MILKKTFQNITSIIAKAISTGSWYPIWTDDLLENQEANLRVDNAGNLVTRSSVLTDEGSFYEPFAGVALSADWSSVIGTGASISVANSLCTIVSGITSGQLTHIHRETDYPPITFTFTLNVSQRIANQDIYFGYGDNHNNPDADTMFARFHFYGTDNTKVSCETQSSSDTGGGEGLNSQLTIPFGANTAEYLIYRIDNDTKKIRFYIGKSEETMVIVATRSIQMPNPYTVMCQRVRVTNGTTPATSTTINVDTIRCSNINIVDTQVSTGGTIGIVQSVTASAVNSSTVNLNASSSFTGLPEITLGVAGIQVNFKASQQCTIQLQQSIDSINWDVSDSWVIPANIGDSRTFQATSSYFRIIVTNNGSIATTYLRLQIALCPIVECLPRALSNDGRLKVQSTVAPASNNISIQLLYYDIISTPIETNQWQDALSYTVPTGYDLILLTFTSNSSQSGDLTRTVIRQNMASYNTSTNTFTDGFTYIYPAFSSQLFLYVNTLIGNVANDNITITYTNSDGVTNRTATVTLPKNSQVGTRLLITLQTGDYGIRDITNISHSQTGQAGAFIIYGANELFYSILTVASTEYSDYSSSNLLIAPEGSSVSLQYNTTAGGTKIRRITLLASLVPKNI